MGTKQYSIKHWWCNSFTT